MTLVTRARWALLREFSVMMQLLPDLSVMVSPIYGWYQGQYLYLKAVYQGHPTTCCYSPT